MDDWTRYKNKVRATDPEIGKDLDEVEEVSTIVGAMIQQRHNLELSQRDLAELCGIPHSSVARIESGKTTPNLSTLLKIFNQLGLSLTVQSSVNIARPSKKLLTYRIPFLKMLRLSMLRDISYSIRKCSRLPMVRETNCSV